MALSALAPLTVLTAALLPPALPAAAATTSPTITRSAHLAYEGCPAKDVVLTLSVPRHTFGPGQEVTYRVTLHNVSGRSCTVPGQSPPSLPGGKPSGPGGGPLGFLLGPCSPLPVTVDNAAGVDVSPGADAISCPVILGPALAAHATLSTTGSWDQMEGGVRPARIARPAPAGDYRIVVDGKVAVPVTLTRNAVPSASGGFTSMLRPLP
jgi:hypothetical protein